MSQHIILHFVISCFQIFNQTTTKNRGGSYVRKYRVFKSLIKPQHISR